jgi:acetylornithine deacetylase/succinyl-diaminopimelate desuccinylase-like protein
LSDEVLGAPTVNIGSIRGGMAVNIVAGQCEIEVDRRTLPAENHADILNEIRGYLLGLVDEGRIASYEALVTKDTRAWRAPLDSPLRARLGASCRRHGVPPETAGTGWFSDAGALSGVCGDVVVFGPGSIQQAHTADEYIDVAELQKGSDIMADFLMSYAEDRAPEVGS